MNHDLLVARKKFDEKLISQIPKRISVDCNLITAKNPKFLRLLSTDQCLVIPAKTPIRLMVTSDDVIHS
jgi:heme/copper-type cytochrome/quinol oxidase subunit 2